MLVYLFLILCLFLISKERDEFAFLLQALRELLNAVIWDREDEHVFKMRLSEVVFPQSFVF